MTSRAKLWLVEISNDGMYLELTDASRPGYKEEASHKIEYFSRQALAYTSSAAVKKVMVTHRDEIKEGRDIKFSDGQMLIAITRINKKEVIDWEKVIR